MLKIFPGYFILVLLLFTGFEGKVIATSGVSFETPLDMTLVKWDASGTNCSLLFPFDPEEEDLSRPCAAFNSRLHLFPDRVTDPGQFRVSVNASDPPWQPPENS
jgi:hypothetical protein